MSEESPKLDVLKAKSGTPERRKSSHGHLSSDDKTESVETGYGSAPHTSDLQSGAEATSESANWTSEDHGVTDVKPKQSTSIMKRLQKKMRSPRKPAGGSESDSKSEKTPTKPADKGMKLRSHKKSTPPKQVAEVSPKSGQEGPSTTPQAEALTSAESEASQAKKGTEQGAVPKCKSPKKSLLRKLRSPKKITIESASKPGESKTSASPSPSEVSSKSPRKGLSRFQTSKSPKKPVEATSSLSSTKGLLEAEQSQGPGEEKSVKGSASPSKRRGLLKITKAKSPKKKSTSTPSESSGAETPGKVEKDEKSPTKPKRKLKLTHGKTKSPAKQQVKEGSPQPSGEDRPPSKMKQSMAATYELVSSGLQHMELSKQGSDTIPLLPTDEPMETDDSRRKESKSGEGPADKEPLRTASGKRKDFWHPKYTFQRGGYLTEELRASFASSVEDTPTEISTVSDSSAIQGGSESRKGSVTSSDTLSEVFLKDDSLDVARGVEEDAGKPQLQRQKRLKDESSDSDDAGTSQGPSGSPVKKPAPPRREPDDTSE